VIRDTCGAHAARVGKINTSPAGVTQEPIV
jgi:hypothetical protein